MLEKEDRLSLPIEIIRGHAMECPSDLGSFDYVITDPPYPIGGKPSITSPSAVMQARQMIDAMAQSFLAAVIRSVQKNDTFSIWLFCDWKQVSYYGAILQAMGMTSQACIVWDKMRGARSGRYHNRHEMVLWATQGPRATGKYVGQNIIHIPAITGTKKQHPFDKPPELVEEFAKAFPPGRVLDPFCGAGGLLVGARRLGWDVVGVDILQESCNTAGSRLWTEEANRVRLRSASNE